MPANSSNKKLVSSSKSSILLKIKYVEEKIKIGIASIKENCIAFLKDKPSNNAIKIVKPERDKPGSIAVAWARPINNAAKYEIFVPLLLIKYFVEKIKIVRKI